MPSTLPPSSKLDQLLKGLSIPVALSLAATLFSGNTFNLLNDWDWFNGSFNSTTNPPPQHDASGGETNSTAIDPLTPDISIQVNPSIVVHSGALNAWQQVEIGDGPAITLNNDNDVDNRSQSNPVIENSPQFDWVFPIEVNQWMQPQNHYPGLSLVVSGPFQHQNANLFPGENRHFWADQPSRGGFGLVIGSGNARERPQPGGEILSPSSGAGLGAATCLPTAKAEFVESAPTAVPEAKMILGLSLVGVTLLSRVYVQHGRELVG
ncbi:hypothetical protein [Leptolyngbya sp. PCC 6406]|uniref:hypothetical protein n=1 Tax=Leptolyngbya sp. PCC 6406 TaxID=1173264 RepID=UPI0002AD1898|nr:hypothetical protein [Leptolyngbya sp. PCC 6406]